MLGVIVNTVAVLLGGAIGFLMKKGFPKKTADAILFGIGMCTVYIGLSGMFDGKNPLILILSIASGAAIGTPLDLDGRIHRLATSMEQKFRRTEEGGSLAEGFVSGSLLFCVGAMTIVGSLNAGFGDHTMLFTKSMLDFVSAMMLAATLGIGVMLSSVTVLVIQGAIALCAVFLKPYMTAGLIGELTCVGSLMVMVIGLNMAGVTKVKVADFLPALLLTPLFYYLFGLIPGLS